MRLVAALHMSAPEWPSIELPAPPEYQPFLTGLSLRAVESVMNARVEGRSFEDIPNLVSVDPVNVGLIANRCNELMRRTGLSLSAKGLHLPRQTELYPKLMARLAKKPHGLGALAQEWVNCARIKSPPGTVALISTTAVDGLKALAKAIQCDLNSKEAGNGGVGYYLMDKGEHAYGSAQILKWAFAVIWVASGLEACRALQLTDS